MQNTTSFVKKSAYSVEDACRKLSIGRTLFNKLVKSGEITTVRLGKKILVTSSELRRVMDNIKGAGNAAKKSNPSLPIPVAEVVAHAPRVARRSETRLLELGAAFLRLARTTAQLPSADVDCLIDALETAYCDPENADPAKIAEAFGLSGKR